MRLEPLCEMTLSYRGTFILARPYGGEAGSGYGEGEGSASGERLRGTVRWANHPKRRTDGAMLPDAHGVIATDDGADVLFTLRGRTIFRHGLQGRQDLVALFESEHERYRWLNDIICVAEGLIAMPASRLRIYVCVNELV